MKQLSGIIVICACAALLCGCAGSPARIGMASPAQLAQENELNLINAWDFSKSKNARAELERRGTFTAEEWSLIDRKIVRIGMRELAVYASWGLPGDTNTTHTSRGVHKQLVYGSGARYVYTDNGIVTAIQD